MKTFHLITLFPESFSSYLGESILARAQKQKKIKINFYNPRDFVKPTKVQRGKMKPYLRVDEKPYGGGPGMVMQAMPVIKAIEKAVTTAKAALVQHGTVTFDSLYYVGGFAHGYPLQASVVDVVDATGMNFCCAQAAGPCSRPENASASIAPRITAL